MNLILKLGSPLTLLFWNGDVFEDEFVLFLNWNMLYFTIDF